MYKYWYKHNKKFLLPDNKAAPNDNDFINHVLYIFYKETLLWMIVTKYHKNSNNTACTEIINQK